MVRLLLFTFLCLMTRSGWGQSVFRLDSLPTNGVVLDKGWKWHSGDNPDWAKPELDDSGWDTLNPAQELSQLKQLPQHGNGWLRLHLRVATPLRGQAIGLFLQQIGATEIYINGQLTGLTGTINAHQQATVGVIFQISPFVHLTNDSLQVIAVRYAFSSNRLLTRPLPFFRLALLRPEMAKQHKLPVISMLLSSSFWPAFF